MLERNGELSCGEINLEMRHRWIDHQMQMFRARGGFIPIEQGLEGIRGEVGERNFWRKVLLYLEAAMVDEGYLE